MHSMNLAASKNYEDLLDQELFVVEQRAQYYSAWFMLLSAFIVYSSSFADSLRLSDAFKWFIHFIMILLVFWYLGTILIIRQGYYKRIFKYINVGFQVSLVSFFLMASAKINSIEFALSSAAPLFYIVVIGVSSASMNPLLCLLAGAIAASQFVAMYGFWFYQQLDFSVADPNLFGWPAIFIHAFLFLLMGLVAMVMAKRARSLLETVVTQVRYGEQLKVIERDIAQAAHIQQNLIPLRKPEIDFLEVDAFYSPCRLVGGDYIDYIKRPSGNYMIVIGDVSGKGIAAAMLMSSIQAMVRLYAQQHLQLPELMTALNRSLYKIVTQGRFVSLVCFEFSQNRHKLQLVNCGHNAPLLVNQAGQMQSLIAEFPVLGVQAHQHYEAQTYDFNPGDLLFAYTDGLSELRDSSQKMFGVNAIEAIVKRCNQLRAHQLKSTLIKVIQEYLQDESLSQKNDDLSFICVRRLHSKQ